MLKAEGGKKYKLKGQLPVPLHHRRSAANDTKLTERQADYCLFTYLSKSADTEIWGSPHTPAFRPVTKAQKIEKGDYRRGEPPSPTQPSPSKL